MDWQYPQAFYLLLPLSAAWIGAALYGRARCRKAAETFVAAAMFSRLLPRESAGRFWAKLALFELAIVFAIMALARPQFGTYFENIQPRGSDIYALIDVSKSMLADDVPPSRLARAKSDVAGLLNRLKGERIGLIAFAGKAAVKCPLTTDYNFYRMSLNDLDPSSAPRGGTAIGDAIRKALEVMPPEPDRDKVILLITDGDDQQSYPLDAAAQAAEQHVAIFAIGLGDTTQGARIPVGSKDAQSFMAYKGEQVWTKLNGELLQQIAMKTQGVYVPAGTKAYDLGQLYEDKLAHMRSAAGVEQKRERRSEQYQVFLALAVLCLLLDLLIKLYPAAEVAAPIPSTKPNAKRTAPVAAALLLATLCGFTHAGEPHDLVKEGVELYKKNDFDAAKEKFTQADEPTRKTEGPDNAIVAFDLACAYHRKGDAEKARENYLKAGLSRDKSVASAAYYNYASLAAETARTLAGDKPEEIAPDKRQEILDKLKEAVTHYRACLELKPEYPGARKNIELIRQWIKLYKEKWREHDRQKTRSETNLLQFLEYLIGAQRAIRESVLELDKTSPADTFAERKQAQDELLDEIPPLKDKIKQAIDDAAQGKGQPPGAKTPDVKQVDETLKLLNGLADEAGKRMMTSSVHLNGRDAKAAAAEEKAAIDELDKIWSIAAPFRSLLSRTLADQTEIVQRLDPEGTLQQPDGPVTQGLKWFKDTFKLKYKETPPPALEKKEEPEKQPPLSAEEVTQVTELQDLNKRHTEMMRVKAELELESVEKMPPPQAPPTPPPPDPNNPGADPQQQQPQQPSPEEIKRGLKVAIELAPKAVEQMTKAHGELTQQKPKSALPPAEEARKILEEIAKAQPQDKNQNKDQQDKKDENQEKKDDKQDQKKEDEQKKDDQKKDEQKKDQDQKKDEQKEQKEQKVQMSKEQAEELLRKIREREQDRRKKQQEERVRAVGKGDGVDKDW